MLAKTPDGPDMEHGTTNQTSNTPSIHDLFADMGGYYVRILRDLSQDSDAPGSLRKDWATIRDWLGCHDNELTTKHDEKIGRAWLAYLAIGLAPSHKLQPVFDSIHARYKNSNLKLDRPPVEIMDAFDRLLATDDQISRKRASDLIAEQQKFAKIIGKLPGKTKQGWWRRQSRSVRSWIFVSAVWAAIALFIITVFDPLDIGGWDWATDRDYLKAMAIMLLPALVGLLKAAYTKAVR